MTTSDLESSKGDQARWDNALQNNRERVVPAIGELLKAIQPYRGRSMELNQLIQELTFLQASLALELKLPKDWQVRLIRTVRSNCLQSIPHAKELARELLQVLSVPVQAPGSNVVEAAPAFVLAAGNSQAKKHEKYSLRLFISGKTRPSVRAVENLKALVANLDDCEWEVIDIREHPELAESERIVATPTLVRESPPPRRKIIGDLSDTSTVLLILSA